MKIARVWPLAVLFLQHGVRTAPGEYFEFLPAKPVKRKIQKVIVDRNAALSQWNRAAPGL